MIQFLHSRFCKKARGVRSLAFLYAAKAVPHKGVLVIGLLLMAGCATYQTKVYMGRNLIREGRVVEAAEQLKVEAQKPTDDQLVYLFDYGTALQLSGDYSKSNKAFLHAEELSEVKDYHSISRITGSLLLNEGMVQYKGEDYEKVLVNAMLAINFLMMGDLDAALVETRKLNEKLYKYKFEAKRNYEQNPFAFYLAALIWEADKKWDDAYLDYKKAYELVPQVPYLREDLIRSAKNARRHSELEKWKKQFPTVKEQAKWDPRKYGELVLIYQQGWGPRKQPHPEAPRFPTLRPVNSFTQQAQLIVEKGPTERTQRIYSVEDVAIKTLDDAYGPLIAKRMAGLATKAVVADQLRQKNELLGELAWIGMNLADRADLRQWSTLPESFQVAKVRLKPGTYRVKVDGLSQAGAATGEGLDWQEVQVKAGAKTFINWRSVK